jgi:hypothetical protein
MLPVWRVIGDLIRFRLLRALVEVPRIAEPEMCDGRTGLAVAASIGNWGNGSGRMVPVRVNRRHSRSRAADQHFGPLGRGRVERCRGLWIHLIGHATPEKRCDAAD